LDELENPTILFVDHTTGNFSNSAVTLAQKEGTAWNLHELSDLGFTGNFSSFDWPIKPTPARATSSTTRFI
jgi:hypothetical protein